MSRRTLFVDVLLPLHLPGYYTYRVPVDYNKAITVGQRVAVQFGRTRLYSALVRRVHEEVPPYPTKYILAILDVTPLVSLRQFSFWEWMAQYYMCYPGDVMAVALPTAFRMSSESYLTIHPEFDGSIDDLSENEVKVIQVLQTKETLPVSQVSAVTGFAKIMPLLKTMMEKRLIILKEELQQRYVPKAVPFLYLAPQYLESAAMQALFAQLESKSTTHKQLSVLMLFMQLTHFGKERIAKKALTEHTELSASAIATLIRNGVLVQENETFSRLVNRDASGNPDDITLNEEQQTAYDTLRRNKGVSLLQGVTSSGKTEVYIKLIADMLQQGRQVLFLLPEIALTAQLINRLRRYFGNAVGVYHSRFNINERAEVWQRTMDDSPRGYQVLVGARSAIFLPFHDLGLVIVDEEHDSSYKQSEPAPRYQGRDCAIFLAQIYGANTILGSATPSIESTFNVRNGKYGFAQLRHRYGGIEMPMVECVDMRSATKEKRVKLSLSDTLIDAIDKALKNNEQVILFQNRRGFSLHLECNDCHWIPTCPNCDVSLVYHKSNNSLRCHHCGHCIPVPTECHACHSHALTMKGFGTERIEEDLAILFPSAKVVRMDMDSTSSKSRYIEIINDFEDHNIDILVGTQMVTKGLDFDRVSVVGILSADSIISYPDFRSYEHAYQLMTQVAGRAGRRGKKGRVLIQTFQPEHPVINDAIRNDYDHMYDTQIQDRRIFRYPPYYRLITLTMKHKESGVLDNAATIMAATLRASFGIRIMGPEYPIIPRLRRQYLKQVFIRFERSEGFSDGKALILGITEKLKTQPAFKGVTMSFDVDPM